MALYKYMKKEFYDEFFKSGILKIGTLYEYKNIEKLGGVIGDQDEGIIREMFRPGRNMSFRIGDRSPEGTFLEKSLLSTMGPDDYSKITIKVHDYSSINFISEAPDCYIYCTSSEFSYKVMEDFECDRCMEIVNPDLFFKSIGKKIKNRCKFQGVYEIEYLNRQMNYTDCNNRYPSLIKDPLYSYQKEIRAIWNPVGNVKNCLIKRIPKAIQYCKRFID